MTFQHWQHIRHFIFLLAFPSITFITLFFSPVVAFSSLWSPASTSLFPASSYLWLEVIPNHVKFILSYSAFLGPALFRITWSRNTRIQSLFLKCSFTFLIILLFSLRSSGVSGKFLVSFLFGVLIFLSTISLSFLLLCVMLGGELPSVADLALPATGYSELPAKINEWI